MTGNLTHEAHPPERPHLGRGPYPGIPFVRVLYYGTTAPNHTSIMRTGLRPRTEVQDGGSEWPARPGWVGLTRANALYYADNHCEHSLHLFDGPRSPVLDAVIYEIDTTFLDPQNLYPDEVYLGWATDMAGDPDYGESIPKPASLSLVRNRREWVRSLENLGLISYKGTIPREAITRYGVVSRTKCPKLMTHVWAGDFDDEWNPLLQRRLAALTAHIFDATPLMDEAWQHESYESLLVEYADLRQAALEGDRHASGKMALIAEQLDKIREIGFSRTICESERATGVRVVNLR